MNMGRAINSCLFSLFTLCGALSHAAPPARITVGYEIEFVPHSHRNPSPDWFQKFNQAGFSSPTVRSLGKAWQTTFPNYPEILVLENWADKPANTFPLGAAIFADILALRQSVDFRLAFTYDRGDILGGHRIRGMARFSSPSNPDLGANEGMLVLTPDSNRTTIAHEGRHLKDWKDGLFVRLRADLRSLKPSLLIFNQVEDFITELRAYATELTIGEKDADALEIFWTHFQMPVLALPKTNPIFWHNYLKLVEIYVQDIPDNELVDLVLDSLAANIQRGYALPPHIENRLQMQLEKKQVSLFDLDCKKLLGAVSVAQRNNPNNRN